MSVGEWVFSLSDALRAINSTMTPKLTKELRLALQASPGKPLRVEDEETHKVYLVMSEETLPTLWEDYIRREVKRGLDAIGRGEVEDWDIESIKTEGRHVLKQGPPQMS